MDTAVEKSCLDEISHTVLDSKGKISVRTLSNNYEISFADAVKVLQRWIDANGSKAKLSPEFIVRGIDSKGTPFITMANEKRLKTIQTKAERVSSLLYALEVASESSRKLNVPVDQEFRAIALPLKTDKRDVKVFVPIESKAAPVVKQEAKSKSIFGAAASSSKVAPKADPAKVTTVKEEKQSPPAATPVVKKEPTPTKPAGSPTKVSPSKKKDAKKPVATGKSSIASFFSNKPGAVAKPAASKQVEKVVEKPVQVKEEKLSPKQEEKKPAKEDETQRWKRMISDESSGDDEVIPNTPQDKKPEKKKGGRKPMTFKKGAAANKANPSKKSRILQVEDSSEEEEEERGLKEPEERLVAFEVEESDDAEMKDAKELSPEKPIENDSSSANRGRAKVKKLVTKTFMDEEGYLTTIKEYQMVSASEDEGEGDSAVNKNNSESVANGKKDSTGTGKGKLETKTTDKKAPPASKVTPPTPKTKQGSIMSFFAKK